MRVKEIVIDGFKSYAKRTVITSWDAQFNCITGLNGSGKSNILDAICFVLGITTMSTVRAQNQQDLIYKRGQAGVTKASVSIVFDNTDKSRSPLDYREVDTITVTRQVVMGGTSKYLVNGHRAQQAQVQQLFQEVQLNINNPNFLIMQGQITKVVNMRPKELLGLIEEAAGTGMYEKERLRALKEIQDRDAPLRETEALLTEEVRPKLEKLRAQKREFLEFQQVAASTEEMERVVVTSEWHQGNSELAKLETRAELHNVQAGTLRAQLEAESLRIAELARRIEELRPLSGSEESARLEAELQAAQEEHARAATANEDNQRLKASLQEQIQCSDQEIMRIRSELLAYEQSVGAFEDEHNELSAKLKDQRARVAELRELLSGLQTGISTTGERETGYAYSAKVAREAVAKADRELKSLQSAAERLSAGRMQSDRRVRLKAERDQDSAKLSEVRALCMAKQQLLDDLKANEERDVKLTKQEAELKDESASKMRDLDLLIAEHPNLEIPRNAQFPTQIRGRVAHIFKILDQHLDKLKALEVTAGAGLWSLVVDNERVGSAVLKNSRRRLTILPLNRMRTNPLSRDLVSKIDPSAAWLAQDLIGFDEDVRPAIEHVFGRTVVCATSAIAERAAFKFRVRAVTLDGDVFDPRGVISGGSMQRAQGGGTIFSAVSEYHTFVRRIEEINIMISQVKDELASVGGAAIEARQLKNELELLHREVEIVESRLGSTEETLSKAEELDAELDEILNTRIPEATGAISASQEKLQKTLSDAAEFAANRDGKLRELRSEAEEAITEENRLGDEVEKRAAEHGQNQSHLAKLRTELAQEDTEVTAARTALAAAEAEMTQLESILRQTMERITQLDSSLKQEVSRTASVQSELQDSEAELASLQRNLAETKLELQRIGHDQEKFQAAFALARTKLADIERKWPWARESASAFSASDLKSGLDLEQLKHNLAQEQRRMNSLGSRVDASVITMIERLETDEEQLRLRLTTIREDRRKLEESMETLNERRRTTIDSVWRQVSKEFGAIFGDLLPSSSTELVPLNNNPIEHGFALRVRLGATWKYGLTELSGGQRSLVALALILALLRYHPAPVYILDEVDAALDVHHTRNIGHIIKTRFQNAQFIVVSLKDDMFTNANRIYQTRFIDGNSTVAIMV